MNIKPYDKTIRDLLQSKRQFVIPRFQREYVFVQVLKDIVQIAGGVDHLRSYRA